MSDRVGPVEVYRRAIGAGGQVSLNFRWSIDAAILDVHTRDLPPDRKAFLRGQAEAP